MAKMSVPREIDRQVTWLVRQYDRLKKEYKSLAWQSSDHETVSGRTNKVSRPVETRAIRAAYLSSSIGAIDKALEKLPEYYRKPVFNRVAYRMQWPPLADRNTYAKYRRLFIFYTAIYLGWYWED